MTLAFALLLVGASPIAASPAGAQGAVRDEDADVAASLAPPPLAPFRAGPSIEGTVGVYAPTGRLSKVSAPGPWIRVTVGWDLTRWLAFYGAGDAAFLVTGRAPAPPAPRAYVLYGVGGGAKVSLPIGARVRIPLRAELGVRTVDDGGLLEIYGFGRTRDLGLSWGATAGVEWRAASRHFGLVLEGGVRNDDVVVAPARESMALAVVAGIGIHYTL